jgi:hypothetical protein
MSNIPAFPSKQKALMIKSEHIDIASEYEIEHNGMTLRDYFAAKAMQALIDNDGLFSEIPTQAYELANAIMKARKE